MIDNPKIKSWAPFEFASFRGLSYLFENPGSTVEPTTDGMLLRGDLENNKGLRLYRLLNRALRIRVSLVRLMERYRYCPAPSSTFHVTVADLVNPDNIGQLAAERRDDMLSVLRDLPHSLERPLLSRIPAIAAPEDAMRFRVKQLQIRRSALVAPLEACDSASARAVERIAAGRRDAMQYLTSGVPETWEPHVTLGYFASSSLLKAAGEELPRWNDLALREVEGECIAFGGVRLFGFESMALYWAAPAAQAHFA